MGIELERRAVGTCKSDREACFFGRKDMRARIVRSIAVIAGLTLFPVVGTAANLSINTDWADKAVIAGKPAYLAISAVPDRAVIEVTAEGSLGSIQDNDGVFSIETITGTATAELDGETVDEIYTINVDQLLKSRG